MSNNVGVLLALSLDITSLKGLKFSLRIVKRNLATDDKENKVKTRQQSQP